jgi:hypothetical protein
MNLTRKEAQAKVHRELYAARRAAYIQVYGPCKECGSWENLEFHHRDPKTKTNYKGNLWSWSKIRRITELAKCDILCKSCHLAARLFVHGTHNCYRRGNCRCILCKKAQLVKCREYEAKRIRKRRD